MKEQVDIDVEEKNNDTDDEGIKDTLTCPTCYGEFRATKLRVLLCGIDAAEGERLQERCVG